MHGIETAWNTRSSAAQEEFHKLMPALFERLSLNGRYAFLQGLEKFESVRKTITDLNHGKGVADLGASSSATSARGLNAPRRFGGGWPSC
jgi:hypothetical protein